jgi:hypothetical protein
MSHFLDEFQKGTDTHTALPHRDKQANCKVTQAAEYRLAEMWSEAARPAKRAAAVKAKTEDFS